MNQILYLQTKKEPLDPGVVMAQVNESRNKLETRNGQDRPCETRKEDKLLP